MYSTLCRAYRCSDGPSKEKEDSGSSKAVTRYYEGGKSIIYH